MKTIPLSERQEFWKFQSAASTFEQAATACATLLLPDVNENHPLFYPMMLALHALYGRPFKQRQPMRIDEAIVPTGFQKEHTSLIAMRDKIFAHVDATGIKTTEDAFLNKVIVSVRGSTARRGIVFLFPRDLAVVRIKSLATELKSKCLYHADKIWRRTMANEPLPTGDYEVNISGENDSLLIPLKF